MRCYTCKNTGMKRRKEKRRCLPNECPRPWGQPAKGCGGELAWHGWHPPAGLGRGERGTGTGR